MKVAIAWYGAEGQSNYRYFVDKGHDVTIVTPKLSLDYPAPLGAKIIVGDDAFKQLGDFDLVVRSAGVRPESLLTNGKVWSATNEFFTRCPAPIIGVTGTKGKGTTCSMITSILRQAGRTVHLVGNIGVPPLDALSQVGPEDIVVYELSSFQLWDIEKSPHIAVVLMIEPDHLDVHADMAEYVAAKAGITRHQTPDDTVIYHPLNQLSKQVADQSQGRTLHYADSGRDEVYIRDDAFYRNDIRICGTDAVQLTGDFNRENACAAIAACAEILEDLSSVEAGLRSFAGLPHRLKFVREVHGVKWYDDSIATTPGSAIAALTSFREPVTIILGGSDKGSSYDEIIVMAKKVGARVVAIGSTGEKITQLCHTHHVEVIRHTGLMVNVVDDISKVAKSGDIVILSPASASFDQYKSYKDRGNQFIEAVEGIA